MQARIIGIRQELSFEDGESANFMMMELPNGSVIQAPIDDDTMRELTVSFVKGGGVAAQQAVARAQAETAVRDEFTKVPAEQLRQQAAAPSAHPALANPMRSSNTELSSDHTPLSVQDAADYEFGGGFVPGSAPADVDEDADLEQMQAQFRQASERVSQAAASGSLADVAQALGQPEGSMPVPDWAASEQPQRQRMRQRSIASPVALAAVTVEADAKGNPILKGSGLVDPYELTGPTDEQGEAAQL